MLFVIFPNQIQHDSTALPNHKVVVGMVNKRWVAAVGVECCESGLLLFN